MPVVTALYMNIPLEWFWDFQDTPCVISGIYEGSIFFYFEFYVRTILRCVVWTTIKMPTCLNTQTHIPTLLYKILMFFFKITSNKKARDTVTSNKKASGSYEVGKTDQKDEWQLRATRLGIWENRSIKMCDGYGYG